MKIQEERVGRKRNANDTNAPKKKIGRREEEKKVVGDEGEDREINESESERARDKE